MHSISQCCCLAKAEQCCCYDCWVSLSARHSRLLFTDVLALKTACSCSALSFQKWERAEGVILGSCSLMNLYADWTRFTLKQIRAAFFLGANLAISMLPYRSLSTQSSHSGRQERWGAGGARETDSGWSEDDPLSEFRTEGRGQLWHISTMKVNGTEDLQDNANGVETKAVTET